MTSIDDLVWAQVDMLIKRPEPEPVNEFICRTCGGVLLFGAGELPVCGECGRCVDSWLSDEPEWTGGADEDGHGDPSRIGAPIDTDLYSEKWGMNTMIIGGSKLMAKINMHSGMNHKDRALFHAYDDIQKAANRAGIPENVTRGAKMLYRKFNEEKLTRGAVRTGIKANCLLISCKMNGVSRTTHEIADAFDISTTDISRTINMFKQITQTSQVSATFASDLLTRKLGSWELTGQKRMKIINVCRSIEKTPELIGKTPKCIACTVAYVLLENVQKSDVCKIFDVSVPTVTKLEPLVREAVNFINS